MPAIITDRFKKEILLNLQADIDSAANNFYVTVGRPIDWNGTDTAPTPTNAIRTVRDARHNMTAIKNVEAHSFVIPRYTWSLGAIYQAYNDNSVGHPSNSFYVVTDENNIYVCLEAGQTALGQSVTSTVKPSGTLNTAFETADGYVWKFLYSIGALRASQFLSANFMPVTVFGPFDSDDPADHVEQVGVQNAASPGEVVGYQVLSGGSGYTTVPTVQVIGNGVAASATATVSGGAVTKINVKDSDGNKAHGRNFTQAYIKITGGNGSGAVGRPIIGPKAGFGADPRDDLKATAMMFTAKPSGDEGSNWVIGNDFRQVTLIKNIELPDSDALYTGVTGNALRRMKFSNGAPSFTADKTLVGNSSEARAYVVKTDSDEVWYIQDSDTGFEPFTEGEVVGEADGSGSGTLEAAGVDADANTYLNGDVDTSTGEIMYIDNRAAIQRSADQTEDIKIIIQL
tara:strand:+ start:547 stop:1914 length:1368 start_codon:yes stop_codon:yes gene_type:complete